MLNIHVAHPSRLKESEIMRHAELYDFAHLTNNCITINFVSEDIGQCLSMFTLILSLFYGLCILQSCGI